MSELFQTIEQAFNLTAIAVAPQVAAGRLSAGRLECDDRQGLIG